MTESLLAIPAGVAVLKPVSVQGAAILTEEALSFIAGLERAFGSRRLELLAARQARRLRLEHGDFPAFLAETAHIRASEWTVAPTPPDLMNRRVEITGPTDRKMIINALNSGASVFMADFEDANSPTWNNMVEGQANLCEAIRGDIHYESPDGRVYRLNETCAVLMVRPRGWHLEEKNLLVDGLPISAAIFDFGLYFFHNARALLAKSSGPYFYLPKLESHLEARLWNDIFVHAQENLGLPVGAIRATVLVETILAAFEMDEILYELRDHAAGLNAGRWDYIFSIIKNFNRQPGFYLPDRAQVRMTVPFMRSYTNLLVKTCHRRGAHAMGGMAAFIPSRKDASVNERALAAIRDDKLREVGDGFDGTWVAHPDIVGVAREIFDRHLGDRPHQKEQKREDVQVSPADLVDFHVEGGAVTEAGIRNNINVSLQYIAAWLTGRGAVGIFNLMEDTATAEIARSQLWQWLHQPEVRIDEIRHFNSRIFLQWVDEEIEKIRRQFIPEEFAGFPFAVAKKLLEALVLADQFVDFLTIPGYDLLENNA